MKNLTNDQVRELKTKFGEEEVQAYLRIEKEIEAIKLQQNEASPEEVARVMAHIKI